MPLMTPVRQLDALLNRRITRARHPREVGHWWAVKVRAKRFLALAAPRDVDRLATRMINVLDDTRYGARRRAA